MEIQDLVKEETLEEMEARLGTVGEYTPEFKHLEGMGATQRNMVLERDFGLVIDDGGVVRDIETGAVIDEVKLRIE